MILGESLDPSAATKLLGMRPSQQWRRGDQKSFKRKDGSVCLFDSPHEWGGWKKWSSAAEQKKEFPALLSHWCSKLTSKKKALSRLRTSGSELFLDCFLIGDSSEFILPPPLLAKLSSLGVSLRVTFSNNEGDSNCGTNQHI
jgi:hypothetical protein